MKLIKAAVMFMCFVFLVAGLAISSKADARNEKVFFTFSGPVEIPGPAGARPMVIPAGTYLFKIVKSLPDRNIVEIYNKNEDHLYSTVIAVPDYRMRPTGQAVIKFKKTGPHSPEAVKAWFYPGDNFGQEFVYPKSRATELAKNTNEPVLSRPDGASHSSTSSSSANYSNSNNHISNSGNTANSSNSSTSANASNSMDKAPVKAEKPDGQEVQVWEVIETSNPAGNQAMNQTH